MNAGEAYYIDRMRNSNTPETERFFAGVNWVGDTVWKLIIIPGVVIVGAVMAIALVIGIGGAATGQFDTAPVETTTSTNTGVATEEALARCARFLPSNNANTESRVASSQRYHDCVYG